MRVVESHKNDLIIANGHTVVPLSDRCFEAILRVCEPAGGEFMAYWTLAPYVVQIGTNCRRWSMDKKPDIEADMCRVHIDMTDPWKIDVPCWDRWRAKFAGKYPKSIARIQAAVERIVNAS